MNRLTYDDQMFGATIKGKMSVRGDCATFNKAVRSLFGYELTGFTPAEITEMKNENASLRAELKAITKQINRVRSCKTCAHHKSDVFENPCAVCNMIVKQNFEWARPCPANTPAQGETDEPRGGGEQ